MRPRRRPVSRRPPSHESESAQLSAASAAAALRRRGQRSRAHRQTSESLAAQWHHKFKCVAAAELGCTFKYVAGLLVGRLGVNAGASVTRLTSHGHSGTVAGTEPAAECHAAGPGAGQ